MATKKSLIDDILLRIYAGKPSDDMELSERQIAHWLDIERDTLLQFVFNEALRKGHSIDPFYYIYESCNELTKETFDCDDPDCTEFRYYFTITNDVLPLSKDRGIIYVRDKFGKLLGHTTLNKSDYLRDLPYGGITSQDQAFYREGKKIYIEESSSSSATEYSYHIAYVPMGLGFDTANDEEYPLEDGLIPLLLERVEEVARRQMGMGIADLDNDGADPYHD